MKRLRTPSWSSGRMAVRFLCGFITMCAHGYRMGSFGGFEIIKVKSR